MTAGRSLGVYDEIADVEELIDEIGEVTGSSVSDAKISAAREAYDALCAADRRQVGNLAKLTAAEDKRQQLKNTAKVMELIDAIGTVENTTASKAKICLKRSRQSRTCNNVIKKESAWITPRAFLLPGTYRHLTIQL